MTRTLAVISWVCLWAGCQPRQQLQPVSQTPAPVPTSTTTTHTSSPASSSPTLRQVDKSTLLAFLERGPGYMLSFVEVDAVVAGKRHLGWKVIGIQEGVPLDVRVGDTVTSINGMALTKPDDLMDLYRTLRSASEVRMALLRPSEAGSPAPIVQTIAIVPR